MAGRRRADFRGGDLSEELGVLLLKAVAAVAPVPRPEDVGLDAVATLLRRDGKYLIAEDSFYVQFKSASETRVVYQEHEIRWARELKLPLFIGRVDKATSSIELFTTHGLHAIFAEYISYEKLTMYFGKPSDRPCLDGGYREMSLGPAVHRWTTQDLGDPEAAENTYRILKPFIANEQRNVETRPLRFFEGIRWETGQIPNTQQAYFTMGCWIDREDFRSILKAIQPFLSRIGMDALSRRDREDFGLITDIIAFMRKHGFDPDPNESHTMMGSIAELWESTSGGLESLKSDVPPQP